MSFVTINKYLYGDVDGAADVTARNPASDCPAFGSGLIESVKVSLMAGEEAAEARDNLTVLQDQLKTMSDTSLSAIEAKFSEVTQSFGAEILRRQDQREHEFVQLFTILNESLLFANSNSEHSSTFTAKLESSLRAAIRTQNVQALRGHLSEMLALVQEEVKHQTKKSSDDLASINQQAHQAKKAFYGVSKVLGSREEAVAALDSTLLAPPKSGNWCSGIFVIERLRAIRARYGADVVSELTSELFRKRLQPIAQDVKGYLWTPESIILLFHQDKDRAEVREEVAARVAGPFEHRAQLGMRSASLSVELRWVIAPVEGILNDNIWAFDRFVEGR